MRLWFVVLIGALGACAAPSVRPSAAAVDFRDIVLRDADGRATTLRGAATGGPTLISFWAPWCAPCVKEQPELERLARAARSCGGTVVGVAVGETPDAIATYARARGVTFRQLTDERFELADAIGQRRIPALLVLDGAGRLVLSGDALDERVIAALRGVMPVSPCALR